MKYILLVQLVLFFSVLSCTKENATETLPQDQGCVERKTVGVNDHGVNCKELTEINRLFRINGIQNVDLRFSRLVRDSIQVYYPKPGKVEIESVLADRYGNGLRILNGYVTYIFRNDTLDTKNSISSVRRSVDTLPQLNLAQVRKLFVDDVLKFDHQQYQDTCVTAEFGYYDLNGGSGLGSEELVKAWRVTRKKAGNSPIFPVGYYQDEDGKTLFYDNGIMTAEGMKGGEGKRRIQH